MTQTAIQPEASPAVPKKPALKRLGSYLLRALAGAAVGGLLGWFLITDRGSLGVGIGAVLGWYLARAIWGIVVGAGFGWFFITGASGTVAGMAVGTMIACNIVGRKGRWIVLAVVLVVTLVDILSKESWRHYILQHIGYN